MRTSTFIKRVALVLLATALMFTTHVTGQNMGPNDYLTKSKKDKQESTRSGKKISPKMLQMKRMAEKPQTIPSATDIKKAPSNKTSSRASLAVTESGATLFGNLIYSEVMNPTDIGFYSINPNTAEYLPVGVNEILGGAGTVVDGIGYISYADQFWGMIFGLSTIVYDVETNQIIQQVEHSPEDLTQYAANMAYNYVEDKIYALTYTYDASGFTLSTFDRETYTYNKVTDLSPTADIFAMAFDTEGTLYIICADGKIRELDPNTGEEIREVLDTGFLPEYMQSACWSPKDNKILWAASNETYSHILAIDVQAGTTETLCTFDFAEEWTALYTTDPMASEDAPVAPVVTQNFNAPGSLTGTIVVEVPTTTLAGDALTAGDLNLIVKLNDVDIYNAQVQPGQEVTLSDKLFVEGMNTIRAYASNAAGDGIATTKKVYAGEDTPLPVTNVNIDINDAGLATLTWDAPTGGENNGFLNTSTLTYTVERSGETKATGLTTNTFTEQLPEQLAQYQWKIYAVSGDKVSKPAVSQSIIFGNGINLPYAQTFNNANCIDLYTIVDNNQDDKTWTYDASKSVLQYNYHTSNDADDYAFTPKLQLPNDKMILVEINASSYSENWPETIEVTLGTTTDPTQQTVIIPATQLGWQPETLRAYFKVEEAGEYHIGLHAVSKADSYYLLVNEIKVENGPSFNAPSAVTDVTATAGENGALTTTLTFKAPTLSLGDNTLTENVTVKAYRDEVVIGEVSIAPGAIGNITDNNASNGTNKYKLVTYNSAGEGDIYEISCRCGVDIPSRISELNFTTSDDNLSSVMSWSAPTIGEDGGYINTEELIYTIYTPNGDNVEVVAETSDLFYEITVSDKQLQGYSFYVSAKNIAGESELYGSSVVLGSPYTLPFVEQIESTSLVNSPWYIINESENSYTTWEIGGTMENYNLPEIVTAPDGGMVVCYDFYEFGDGTCGLRVPKISLVGATAPTLYFAMYHYTTASDINELSIKVSTDDITYEEIFAKKVNDVSENGWIGYQISLNEYIDASWISITFDASTSANGFVFIDYIIVENASENDIMVKSLDVHGNTTIGEEIEFTANVFNKGSNPASYTVEFFVDNELLTSMTGTDLASNETNEHTATFTPKTEHLGEIIVKAVVTMEGADDEVGNNNEATNKITIKQPHLRVVTDLEGSADGNKATLTWSEPMLSAEPIVDDMENYESFIIDNIGDYTVVDADKYGTYGIEGVDMPVLNGPKAWQVWAPSELGITTDVWAPYSGDKCLIAFTCWDGPADDWLILPEIMGGTEVSFWASIPTNEYGPESFEVLYSTTDTNIESFQIIEKMSKSTTAWEQFSYVLPDEAKYFAIRYTSYDIFSLLIDDIAYVGTSNTSDLAITGYNVYCNGEKINDAAVTETTYNYNLTNNNEHDFNVTVVYNEGESLYSNTVVIACVGIEDLNKIGVNIYGQDDYIKIENVAGRMVNVYTIDGKVIYNMKATDSNILIPANIGVYIVNIDNSVSCKVIVR